MHPVVEALRSDPAAQEEVSAMAPVARFALVTQGSGLGFEDFSDFYEVLGDVALPALDVMSNMSLLSNTEEKLQYLVRNIHFLVRCYKKWAHSYTPWLSDLRAKYSSSEGRTPLLLLCNQAMGVPQRKTVQSLVEDYLKWIGTDETYGIYEDEETAVEQEIRSMFRELAVNPEDMQGKRRAALRDHPQYNVAMLYMYICMIGRASTYGPLIVEQYDISESGFKGKLRLDIPLSINGEFTGGLTWLRTLQVRSMTLEDYVNEVKLYIHSRLGRPTVEDGSYGLVFTQTDWFSAQDPMSRRLVLKNTLTVGNLHEAGQDSILFIYSPYDQKEVDRDVPRDLQSQMALLKVAYLSEPSILSGLRTYDGMVSDDTLDLLDPYEQDEFARKLARGAGDVEKARAQNQRLREALIRLVPTPEKLTFLNPPPAEWNGGWDSS